MNRKLGPVARATVAAAAMVLLSATVASAHTPVAGAVRTYPQDTALQYRWGGAYPSWFTGAMGSAFGIDWTNSTYNNSRKPTFNYSASGAGEVIYDSRTGLMGCDNVAWIGCAANWGQTNWKVWLRDFTKDPAISTHRWVQTTGTCSGTCFDLRRVALHEIVHVTLAVLGDDPQGEANTIMGSTAPWSGVDGWNKHHVERCDEAAFQLKYDLAALSGRYADCFDHIAGHVSNGLVSTATISAPIASACYGTALSITGRLEILTGPNYETLGGNPLASRTVIIDRKLRAASTWTNNYSSAVATNATTGNNWSRSFTQTGSGSTVTYDYRARYVGETGVAGVTSGVVSLTWRSPCPLSGGL